MKSVFWTAVPASKVAESVWSRFVGVDEMATFDREALAAQFHQPAKGDASGAVRATPRGASAAAQGDGAGGLPAQVKQRLGIVLQGRMKRVSAEQFREALRTGDASAAVIDDQSLAEWCNLVPSADEVRMRAACGVERACDAHS